MPAEPMSETAISVYDGEGEEDAYWWILCTEKYFAAQRTPEAAKMTEAVAAFRGRALRWWLWWHRRHPHVDWETLTVAFLWRFKPEYRDVLPISDEEEEEEPDWDSPIQFQAHYMLGLALLKRQEYAKGIRELEKALDLVRGADPKGYMVEEIWQELAKAKYLEGERASTKRSWELQCLKDACVSALKEKHFLDPSQMEGFVEDATHTHLEQLEALGRVFNKAAEDDIPTEVPDYLCCKITLDIFHDPVITPSGHTYERAMILEHLQKVGRFDPFTRQPLHPSQLVPNLAIKEAVRAFLDKHGWAYKILDVSSPSPSKHKFLT